MRKFYCLLACLILLITLCSCQNNKQNPASQKAEPVSEIYSEQEIQSAMDTVKREIEESCPGNSYEEIRYAGDDAVSKYQIIPKENHIEEVLVLDVIKNKKKQIWAVGRQEGGEWKCIAFDSEK